APGSARRKRPQLVRPMWHWRPRMRELTRRYGVVLASVFAGLTAFWLLALVVFPYIFLAEKSIRPYLPVDQLGGPDDVYTLANYATFLNASSTVHLLFVDIPIHVFIFLETVLFASIVTALTLAFAYPLAYFIAKVAKPQTVPTLFLMLLIPLWVSEI